MRLRGDRKFPVYHDAEMCRKQQRVPLPPPHVLASLVPDSPAFIDLLKVEEKLDWTLVRKKAEINDALGKPIRVSLRFAPAEGEKGRKRGARFGS